MKLNRNEYQSADEFDANIMAMASEFRKFAEHISVYKDLKNRAKLIKV